MSYAQHDPVSQAAPPWPPQPPVPVRGPSRVLPMVGAGLGLLGLIAGVGAWLRPAASDAAASPAYSAEQVAEARGNVCAAYAKGVRSMRVVAARIVDNPADKLPVAVNSRLAEVAVGNYFINVLESNPAAPAELTGPLRKLAQAYQDVALIQLADGTPVDYKSEKEAANESVSKLDQICQ